MKDINFTPAPWRTNLNDHDEPYQDIKIMSGGMSICRVWQDDACFDINPTQKANANLIAAAPDIYDALEVCIKFIENDIGIVGGPETEKARIALAKARGEL